MSKRIIEPNITLYPAPGQSTLVDYIGVVTSRKEDKISVAGLNLTPR